MKTFKKLTWSLLMALFVVSTFNACSDDNDDDNGGVISIVDPSSVFTGGLPKSALGMTIESNDKGLITKITTEDETVTFTYPTATKAEIVVYTVRMTIKDNDDEDKEFLDLVIGNNGFVESCFETYSDSNEEATWEFAYTTEGYLNRMKRSEGDNEVTTIKYTNGNITEVTMKSESDTDNELHTATTYTLNTNEPPLLNKGCVMLFDETFGIDMDEMKYAYWAGLLGKATKNLPTKTVDLEDNSTDTFEWTINANGYPVKMAATGTWGNEDYAFTW